MTNTSKETALKLLKEYSCIQIKPAESETEKENLRQAIKLITSLSEYENIGICADNYQQGFLALSSYLKFLGYEANLNVDSLPKGEDSVYIKFNTQKMNYYGKT